MKRCILKSSLASSTRKAYKEHLDRFNVFMKCYFKRHVWSEGPVNCNITTTFIAYLSTSKYSASTIISNISAIAFIHKLNGWADPCDTFVVKKMLTGAKNVQGSFDVRLPITLEILEKVIVYLWYLLWLNHIMVNWLCKQCSLLPFMHSSEFLSFAQRVIRNEK